MQNVKTAMRNIHAFQGIALKATLFLLPLFFLPLTTDAFDFNKTLMLAVGVLVSLLLWSLTISSADFKLRVTPFDLPVLAFTGAILASAIFVTPNRIDAFIFPGTASQVVVGALLYFLILQYVRGENAEKRGNWLLSSFLWGVGVAAFVALLSGLGAFAGISALPSFAKQVNFNTLGGLVPGVQLFVILLPLVWGGLVYGGTRSTHALSRNIAVGVLLLAGTIVQVFHSLPGKAAFPRFLPLETGWSIALETLKQKPFLGVGVGNFAEAFSRFRPLAFNATDAWNLTFFSSSNWYLHLFTIAGIAGLVTFLWIASRIVNLKKEGDAPRGAQVLRFSLLTALALFLLVPASFVALTVFFILLAFFAGYAGRDVRLAAGVVDPSTSSGRGGMGLIQLLLTVGVIAAFVYGVYRVRPIYAAEMIYKSALESVTKNDGLATYNQMREAIRLNPRMLNYRVTNSQVNLALANSIALNAAQKAQQENPTTGSGQGGEISEEDRNNISKLIQQAISEGKAGVALAPRVASSWTNLARIYRSLMGLANGADQFAIATYQQAISLDPVNPLLRVELGGVLYSLKRYDDAVNAFDLAVAAKPDLANAHYNLAIALREAGKNERALAEFSNTLALVKPDSEEYKQVKADFDSLKEKVDAEASASGQVNPTTGSGQQLPLQAPEQVETVVDPKLPLPQGTEPPAASGQSTSEVEPKPTPTP